MKQDPVREAEVEDVVAVVVVMAVAVEASGVVAMVE